MGTIGVTVGITRVWMRCVVLLRGQKFFRAAFLKFNRIRMAEHGCNIDQFFGNLHVAFVVASGFCDNIWFFIMCHD